MTAPDRLTEIQDRAAGYESAGYTIDRHGWPWIAYRGPRFHPDEIIWLYPAERDEP